MTATTPRPGDARPTDRPERPGTSADRAPAGAMPGRSTTGWWDVGESRLLVRRHDPDGEVEGVVVVVAPPSNEALTTHRTERTLAGRLVARGRAVVRVGLSDASMSALSVPDDRPIAARWEDEVAGAVQHAARLYGVGTVDVVGTRLAAALAVNAAARSDVPARRVVLLAPAGSGRTYLRSMGQLLAISAQSDGLPKPFSTEADGSTPTFGMLLDARSAEHLRGYTLATDLPDDVEVHVVAGSDKPLDKGARALVAAGAVHHPVVGMAAVLDRISTFALVPTDILDVVADTLTAGGPDPAGRAPAADPASAVVVRMPHEVRCEAVDVDGMPGLVTRPAGDIERVLVWSPGATEPVDGPSGLWAHMARRLALHGVATVMYDLEDSGERTRLDRKVDAYPYEESRVAETVRAVRWADRTFDPTPDLGGLCAGAWLAMAAAPHVPVRTLVPVNVEEWTNRPSIIQRVDADPELGLPRRERLPHERGAGPVPAGPAGPPDQDDLRGRHDLPALRRRARMAMKQHLPYRARLELGRRRRIQAPEPFLDAATRHGAVVRMLLTRRDFDLLRRLHGYEALRRLDRCGRDIVVEVDANTDHGMVTAYTRDRVVEFVRRALVGVDRPL